MPNSNTNGSTIPELNIPEKLNWRQKLALKKALKKTKKQQQKIQKEIQNNEKEEQENKQKMQKCILETLEIFDITHKFKKDNKEKNITKNNIKELTYEETQEIFKETIEQLTKIV